MDILVAPVTANALHSQFEFLDASLRAPGVVGSTFRAGFAYATLGGVQSLISHVTSIPVWKTLQKQFLVGIHHAITEPSALDLLAGIEGAAVRVFIPGGRLLRRSLVAKPIFHPKVLSIGKKGNLRFLQAGSANLTTSGVGRRPRNYEFGIGLRADDTNVDSLNRFFPWWQGVWKQAKTVDEDLIKAYARLRLSALEDNPILKFATEAPASISKAKQFFAEVGAGSGPPENRHQIEFPEALARFFGPIRRYRRNLSLQRAGKTWTERPLSYKKTTYGVEIWRLGMPTLSTGGEPIAQRAIQFRRTARNNIFEFDIADVPSNKFSAWTRAANLRGHYGRTQGERAREYGFY